MLDSFRLLAEVHTKDGEVLANFALDFIFSGSNCVYLWNNGVPVRVEDKLCILEAIQVGQI